MARRSSRSSKRFFDEGGAAPSRSSAVQLLAAGGLLFFAWPLARPTGQIRVLSYRSAGIRVRRAGQVVAWGSLEPARQTTLRLCELVRCFGRPEEAHALSSGSRGSDAVRSPGAPRPVPPQLNRSTFEWAASNSQRASSSAESRLTPSGDRSTSASKVFSTRKARFCSAARRDALAAVSTRGASAQPSSCVRLKPRSARRGGRSWFDEAPRSRASLARLADLPSAGRTRPFSLAPLGGDRPPSATSTTRTPAVRLETGRLTASALAGATLELVDPVFIQQHEHSRPHAVLLAQLPPLACR